MKKTTIAAGVFSIACGATPLFYGVFNQGTMILLVSGAALIVLAMYWRALPKLPRTLAVAGLCTGFALCLAVSGLMLRQALRFPPRGEALPVIVLGAKVREDGPSLILARRLDAAAAYLKVNPGAICIVSGGQGPDEPTTEAYAMRKYLIERHGIEPERIIQEDKSSNTAENLSFSRALLGDQTRAAVVTDSFHQLRASIYAGKAGLETYSILSFTPPGLLPAYWVRDILGVLYAWIFT